jgi:transposase, IS5 family
MRRFAGIELSDDRVPDETTILRFRHLLERHELTEAIFAEVRASGGGNQWHFGMKAHIGTDTRGIVHSQTTTDAAVPDLSQPALLPGGGSGGWPSVPSACPLRRRSARSRN